MKLYFKAWKKFAAFRGRAGRQEYWYFVLFNILISIFLAIIAGFIGGKVGANLLGIYSLVVLIPSLAVSVRRLHDNNRSGWWLLIVVIPGIGPILLLLFMLQASEPAENRYGPIPQVATA